MTLPLNGSFGRDKFASQIPREKENLGTWEISLHITSYTTFIYLLTRLRKLIRSLSDTAQQLSK